MQSVPSCELIRRCWWPWSCGLWASCCVSPGFKFITIDPPANSMAPMMYLLHCSCITQGVGIIGGSRLSNLPSTSSSPSLLFAAVSFFIELLFIQCRTCTKLPFHCNVYQIPFSMSAHSLQTDSGWKSYARITPALQSVLKNFRMCSVERFYLNSLYRCPKLTIFDALERILDGAS